MLSQGPVNGSGLPAEQIKKLWEFWEQVEIGDTD
jgi:hypothetical protein